ncbi:MAG: FemAB family XrtA/PEP-CTERM system-associated protein [Opitutaceae bacterium]
MTFSVASDSLAPAALFVREAGEGDRAAWQAFVERVAPRTHAFDWAWRGVIADAFGHEPHYLAAFDSGGGIAGVLPLFFVRSLLFGRLLVSIPYLSGGGILAANPGAVAALHEAARELGGRLRVRRIELRHRWEMPALGEAGDAVSALPAHRHKVAMILALQPDADATFASLPSKLRTRIRRPMRSHLEARVTDGTSFSDSELDGFYPVFSRRMRDLGTPVYPRRFFELTLRAHGPRCRLVTVWDREEPAAGGVVVASGGYIENPWVSASRRHDHLLPNLLVYWEMIKAGCALGCQEFDFGRSTVGSGTYQFKLQWGARPRPLVWHYSLLEGDAPAADPHHGSFSLPVRAWQRLPLIMANRLGPWLVRGLP